VANIAGGAIWATAMVLVGYLAGASWQRAAHWASRIGLALLALIVLSFAVRIAIRATRRRADRLQDRGDRLAATRPARWLRRRFPAQVAWLRRRLDPTAPTGLALTGTLLLAGLLAWTFGGLTQDVAAREGVARLDPRVHTFAVAHRAGWLTAVLANATWLGSNWLLVPILLVATGYLVLRLGDRRAAIAVWATYLGAVALYALSKPLVARARPPAADLIGHASGPSFPSGHAAQALAAWGVLAVVLTAGRSRRTRIAAMAVAALVVLVVGTSRVYLGAHWLTDVLAGYALTGSWLAVLIALRLRRARPPAEQQPVRPTGHGTRPSAALHTAATRVWRTATRRRPRRTVRHRPGTTGPPGR
jgi:membrane-associated phospholipid phosphatase